MKPTPLLIDRPLTHCLVDLRSGKPAIVDRFASLHEAIFKRRVYGSGMRVFRLIRYYGIQELSRKEAAIEKAAWQEMVTEEGIRRRQQFEAEEAAKKEREREEMIARQKEILEREQRRRETEREIMISRSLPPLERLRRDITRKPFALN